MERCSQTRDGKHDVRTSRVAQRGEVVVFKLCRRCGKRRTQTEGPQGQGRLF